MERYFIINLKKLLKKFIKGTISVHTVNDTLIVDIQCKCGSNWRYTLKNIAVELSANLTSKIVSQVIVKEYRKYIIESHFY